jgi:hypothetical protein
MKKIIFLLILCVTNLSYSQETQFKITKDNFTDYVIIPCDGKIQSDLYKKTLDWIAKTYKNPKEVIKSQVENDFIRIEGFETGFNGSSNCNYMIEIYFKDGKIKFDPLSFTIINGINKFDLFSTYKSYFGNDGSVKSRLKPTIEGSENTFNSLIKSLNDFIITGNSKNNDW